MSYAEHIEKVRALRDDPMVNAWISAFQVDRWGTHEDCHHCSFPHSPHVMCGVGAQFGRLKLGKDWYGIDPSNVVYFHDFMLKLGQGWGFHWRNEIFFRRDDAGGVEVRYIEQFNNHPQIKSWHIPPNEWASIVCSVSKEGETFERWNAAQDFHGREPERAAVCNAPK